LEFELKAKFKLINTTPISAGHGSEGAYACMHVPSTATRAYYKCMETEPPRGVFFFWWPTVVIHELFQFRSARPVAYLHC
jgi:hypothetical protein